MADLLDVYLAEYGSLKNEQRDRINARDRLPYVMLTASAAIGFFVFGGLMPLSFFTVPVRHAALLLLPFVGFILGWIYLTNDRKVSEIGRYFRLELASAVGTYIGAGGLLGWEFTHRRAAHHYFRKIMQVVINLLVFCAPGYAAIAACWMMSPAGSMSLAQWAPLFAISAVEIGGLFLLAVEIVRHADIEG